MSCFLLICTYRRLVNLLEMMSQPHTLCHLVLKVSVCDILYYVNQKLVFFTGPLSVDQHLKMVREATWDVRPKWRLFGLELGIDMGTLEVGILFLCCAHCYLWIVSCSQTIERDCCNKTGDCFTCLLEQWLTKPEPPPTWTALTTALKSPSVGHEDIAKNIKALPKAKGQSSCKMS